MKRSPFRLSLAALALAAVTLTAAQAQPAPAPLKKVTIAAGAQLLDSSYPWLMMPIVLGYWKQEGYDVNVIPTGGSLQALQQMVGGNVEFAQVNSTAVIQANTMNNVPARVLMANGIIDWQLVVPEGSAARSVADLKGTKIGVPSLGTGGIPLLRAYLRSNGLDPEKDVTLIPLGIGAPALDAIRTDKVQAAMYWRGMIVIFENSGAKFRAFRDPSWDTSVDYTFSALQKTVDADPKMVEAIVRGSNKATLFAMTNPECVQKLHWAQWPNTKPTGADEATLSRWDMNNLNAQLDTLRAAYKEFGGGKLWGQPTVASYAAMQDFLFDSKVIDKKVEPSSMLLKDAKFYEKTNAFDHEAVIAQAKACKVQ
ncbi:ABC transporter substrate-binding protein [soil metagenome]